MSNLCISKTKLLKKFYLRSTVKKTTFMKEDVRNREKIFN